VIVYLFGFLDDDFFGRVLVTPTTRTIAQLADQLLAWGPTPDRPARVRVTNEAGNVLDPEQSIAAAALGNGDIFTVSGLAG
jgi:hypothetical protein